MSRRHALAGVSVVALQLALLAPATIANANHHLPEIAVDAPTPPKRVANKPAPRPVQGTRRPRRPPAPPPPQQRPVIVVNAEVSGPAMPGTPPTKQRYQLPQTSERITA